MVSICVVVIVLFCMIQYQRTKKRRKKETICSGCSHCPFEDTCGKKEKKII